MQSFFLFFFWKWPTLIYRGQEMTKRMNTEGITMVSSMGRFRKRTTWRQDARECILSPCVLFYYTIVVVHYGFQEVEKKKDFKEGKKLLPLNGNCLENLSIVRNVNTFDDTTKDKLKKKMCYWNRKMSCVCGFLSPLLPLAYQCRKRRFFFVAKKKKNEKAILEGKVLRTWWHNCFNYSFVGAAGSMPIS